MSENEAKAEELLQEAKEQSRKDTEPTTSADDTDSQSLEDAVRDAYHDLDAGDLPQNLTIRDENLAALFAGLKTTGELEAIGNAAANELDRDSDSADTKAGVLRLLVRIGLTEVDESVIESGKEGKKRYEGDTRDAF